MKYLIIVLLLTGCSSLKPYAKVSAGHIVSQREYYTYQDSVYKTNPCDVSARAEIGVEKRVSSTLVMGLLYSHNSNLDCGRPFDDFDEFFKNSVEVSLKMGGVR